MLNTLVSASIQAFHAGEADLQATTKTSKFAMSWSRMRPWMAKAARAKLFLHSRIIDIGCHRTWPSLSIAMA